MSVATIATRLCELCREGQNLQAIEELYSPDIVSVEAAEMEGGEMPRTMNGIEAVRGKTEWWYANNEVHSGDVRGPYFHGDDRFAVFFSMDVTLKEAGQRMLFEEVGIYTVAGDKVVREEFYYAPPGG